MLQEGVVGDEVDLRRVEQIMLATAHGLDPGLTTWQERVVVKGFVEQMVGNWQVAGVLPRAPDPLDLTPTDVMNRYRRWAELERLRLDPAIPWRQDQTLASLLKTCGDRLPVVKEALRMAGIELPEEWEPADG
jgi:hypothetical protein